MSLSLTVSEMLDVDGQCDKLVTETVTSPVYNADRTTKLRASGTISRLRDIVGAHQNLNGLRDLTKTFSGTVCYLFG